MKRDASLSPPPIKRRRLHAAGAKEEQAPPSQPPPQTSTPQQQQQQQQQRPTIRIVSWNINGLQPFIPASAAPITSYFKPIRSPDEASSVTPADHGQHHNSSSLRAFLSRHNWPEVLFLQELKISPTSASRISAALSATLNTPLGPDDEVTPRNSYTVDMVPPRDRFNARGFGGRLYGVGTLLRTDFARRHVARVRDVDWDLEGRVSVVETRPASSTGRPPALINVYAVNGTSAPYKNPRTGKVEGKTRHDHKLAFHSRLRDEALALEGRGFDVVIAGDMNVARGVLDGHPHLRTFPEQHRRNRADFNAKFFGREDNERARAYVDVEQGAPAPEAGEAGERKCFDGVDVFRALHGGERRYTYHPRGKTWGSSADRVDLIVVSNRLWEGGLVRGTGIMDSPQERGSSDHVPLWVEVAIG
ncbi:Endonuclease/exonuclease/phosphatase [Coniochaeta sp. 2T2.1]|nr:Endonuclease/exonuclease/phosphatase [Coniochaeta sp. 2T2.1]